MTHLFPEEAHSEAAHHARPPVHWERETGDVVCSVRTSYDDISWVQGQGGCQFFLSPPEGKLALLDGKHARARYSLHPSWSVSLLAAVADGLGSLCHSAFLAGSSSDGAEVIACKVHPPRIMCAYQAIAGYLLGLSRIFFFNTQLIPSTRYVFCLFWFVCHLAS